MKKIKLNHGYEAIVDDKNYEYLNQWKWRYQEGYAVRSKYLGKIDGKYKIQKVSMHNLVIDVPRGMEPDHIDGDGCNNLESNLRIATRSQNRANRKKFSTNKGKYKGIYWKKSKKRWMAQIRKDGKLVFQKSFLKEKDAAIAYNNAALKFHGEFARLNIV